VCDECVPEGVRVDLVFVFCVCFYPFREFFLIFISCPYAFFLSMFSGIMMSLVSCFFFFESFMLSSLLPVFANSCIALTASLILVPLSSCVYSVAVYA